MSKMIMASIYDAKAEYWSAPRTFRTENDAMRSFEMAINSNEGYGLHPEDYTLFKVGTFYEQDGIIDSAPPSVIATGILLLKTEN